jgi:hypothetical protein
MDVNTCGQCANVCVLFGVISSPQIHLLEKFIPEISQIPRPIDALHPPLDAAALAPESAAYPTANSLRWMTARESSNSPARSFAPGVNWPGALPWH